MRRDRAVPGVAAFDFLLRGMEQDILDRLADVKRDFSNIAVLGASPGLVDALRAGNPERLVTIDPSPRAAAAMRGVAADEDFLPLGNATLDLIAAPLTLQWVNDLPGCLLQIRAALKPDGFFIAAMAGGDTLTELRQVLMQAEIETGQGADQRVSPFAGLKDAGALMQRAGFALPVIDSDTVTVTYADLFALLRDLRGMGATNVLDGPVRFLSRQTLFRAAELYQSRFSEDGRIVATFQMIHMAGWAPHESQQKPLKPGSASHRLADVLGTAEIPIER